MSEIRMTEEEFRKYVDEAFLNGTRATLDVLADIIQALREKAEAKADDGGNK